MNDALPNPPHEPPLHGPAGGPPPAHPPPAQAPYAYVYPVYAAGPPPPPKPANGMGTAAMALGIPCAATAWMAGIGVLSWAGGIVAIVLGSIGLARVKRGQATNRGKALTGVILGALAVAIGIAIVTALVLTWDS